MHELSYNQAMAIQAWQMLWYRQAIGRRGCKAIRARTKPCPANLHPDDKVSAFIINKLVPRGGNFERYFSSWPRNIDPNRYDWCQAMKAGKLYSS